MNLKEITPHLLHEFKSETDLIRATQELSDKFTREREKIGDYLQDKRLVSAYTAFYFTTNFPKLEKVLEWMPAEWIEKIRDCDLVDIGAGPGTMSLAWKKIMGGKGRVYQLEKSTLMQEQARSLWEGLGIEGELIQLKSWNEKNEGPKFVIFGHSANEMGPELTNEYIEKINPDHLLFIEPGTKEFFPQMLQIREELLHQKYQIIFPCPTAERCPMQGTQDWCHQFINVRHDPEVERLTQLVRKDRKLLPLIVHAYSRQEKFEETGERLVRVLPETKFSYEWEVCHNNQIEHYQVMKKNLDKKKQKLVAATLSGAALSSELEKELPEARRVRITDINHLKL